MPSWPAPSRDLRIDVIMTERTRIIGLTGSIGMGKSTAARMLRSMGVPVFSADDCVHELLGPKGAAVDAVAKAFPETRDKDGISRKALGKKVFADEKALARLEAILHPLVREAEKRFIRRQTMARVSVCALEIPLLYETGAEALCDVVVVVSAPDFVQAGRVLARNGMDQKRFETVRDRQMADAEKCARADYVVPTGLGRRQTFNALRDIVKSVTSHSGAEGPADT